MENKRNSISSSMVWNLLERLGTQGAQLIVSIILARILMPEAYGILALITVFVNLATVVIETGFGSSIIQKKDLHRSEIDTIFTLNLLISLLLCAVLWFCAPLIASFYSNYDFSLLTNVIRIYSLILPVGSVTSIQSAVIYRDMAFKKFFFINIISVVISSAVGIVAACLNAGVWALILQQLSAKIALLLTQLVAVSWKPRLNFCFKRSASLFRFGANILFNRLLNMLYNQISSLVIGKNYSSNMLAYYSKGNTFPSLIATNTDYALQKVMFSAYSKYQDDKAQVCELMRKTITLSTFLLSPLLFGMFACAENFVLVVLTQKWLPSVVYMQIFCMSFFLQPIGTTAAQALNGIGRSDITLKVGVVTKCVGIVIVLATVQFGVIYIALGVLLTTVMSSLVYMIVNKRVFGYTLIRQLLDIGANMLAAVSMAAVCMLVGYVCKGIAPIIALCLQVLVGVVWYLLAAVLFKNKSFTYLLGKLKSFKK